MRTRHPRVRFRKANRQHEEVHGRKTPAELMPQEPVLLYQVGDLIHD